MKMMLAGFSVAAMILADLAPAAMAQDYYSLSTQWKGANMPLDIYNGGNTNNYAHLARKGNFSGQMWKITKDGGWYRLTTQFRGDRMCLDIVNGGAQDGMAHLVACGNYSGQLWRID